MKKLFNKVFQSGKKGIFSFADLIDTDKGLFRVQNLECGFEALSHASACETLFLNRLSEKDLRAIMEKTGLTQELSRRGFDKILIDIDRDEGGRHCLSLYNYKHKPENLLMDFKVSEARLVPSAKMRRHLKGGNATLDMINIEWASAHTPGTGFNDKKPRLPGQDRPGLGLLSFMMKMVFAIGRDVTKDGLMAVPDHFHLAMMYSRAFNFLDPAKEGMLRAVMRDLSSSPMHDIAWGFETESVYDSQKGAPLRYEPGEQAYPLSPVLTDYFNSGYYTKTVGRVLNSMKVSLDVQKMKNQKPAKPQWGRI